jgi:hypothetical protein
MTMNTKLTKINESISIYRYDNGYMVEVSGRDSDDVWATERVVFHTSEEAYGFAEQVHSTLPLDR